MASKTYYSPRRRRKPDPSATADDLLTRYSYDDGTAPATWDEPVAIITLDERVDHGTLAANVAKICADAGTTTVIIDNPDARYQSKYDTPQLVEDVVRSVRSKRDFYAPPPSNRHERRRQRAMTRKK